MNKDKTTELKECPFCLGRAEVVYIDNDEACLQGYYPRCSKCSINDDCLFSDVETAIKAWNTRATRPAPSVNEELLSALEEIMDTLRLEANNFYCRALQQCSDDPLLKGHEYKINNGKFGLTEFQAHQDNNKLFGKHYGMMFAINTIAPIFKEAISKANAQAQQVKEGE